MVISREGASPRTPPTAAKQSPSRTATAGERMHPHRHASRPIPLRTRPGKCRALFVMCRVPVDITNLLVLRRMRAESLWLGSQIIIASVAPAVAVSKTPFNPMDNRYHIGPVRVQGRWELLVEQFFPVFFHLQHFLCSFTFFISFFFFCNHQNTLLSCTVPNTFLFLRSIPNSYL